MWYFQCKCDVLFWWLYTFSIINTNFKLFTFLVHGTWGLQFTVWLITSTFNGKDSQLSKSTHQCSRSPSYLLFSVNFLWKLQEWKNHMSVKIQWGMLQWTMLQWTVFIYKIRVLQWTQMLQWTQRNTTGRCSTRKYIELKFSFSWSNNSLCKI
jgi:hypothetical protein